MANDKGWVSIHRKITDNPYYFSEKFTKSQAWIDMIIIANHTAGFFFKRGVKVNVKRGQIGYDLESLAKRWMWSRGKVERFLNDLESERQIVRQKSNVTTLISIVNYDLYQSNDKPNNKPDSNPNGHQTVNQTGKQTDTNNNDNNSNNLNNGNKEGLEDHPSNENFESDLSDKNIDLKPEEKKEEKSSAKKEEMTAEQKSNIAFENSNCTFSTDLEKTFIELLKTKKWKNKAQSAITMSLKKLMDFDEAFSKNLIEISIAGEYEGLVYPNTKKDYEKSKMNAEPVVRGVEAAMKFADVEMWPELRMLDGQKEERLPPNFHRFADVKRR